MSDSARQAHGDEHEERDLQQACPRRKDCELVVPEPIPDPCGTVSAPTSPLTCRRAFEKTMSPRNSPSGMATT